MSQSLITATIGEVVADKIEQGIPVGEAEFTYIDISSIDSSRKRVVKAKRLSVTEAPSRARQRLQIGDVLVSMTRPNLNAVAPVTEEFSGAIGSTGFCVLRPKNIDPAWLYYRVQAFDFIQAMDMLVQGALYPAVRRKDIFGFPIAVPPLEEQKQIVAEIETQFARLDAAVAALERARTRLKRYRASLLKAACEGRLVPTEAELARQDGRDYEPASVLLERIRFEREANANGKRRKTKETQPLDTSKLPDLPEGWVRTTLSDLLAAPLSNGRSVPTADVGFPVLRLTALVNGTVDLTERKIGRWTEAEASRFLVAGDDFLVSRGNGSLKLVGRGGRVSGNPDRVAFPDTLIRVRTFGSVIAPKLLASVWNSQLVREQIESSARTTAGIYKVNQTDLSNVHLPLPPRDEQERIVAEVERRMSVIEQLEATVETNLKRAESLRQSILRMAFQGHLCCNTS